MDPEDLASLSRRGFLIATGVAVAGSALRVVPAAAAPWSLRVEGEVDNPLVLRLEDLKNFRS